MTTRSNDATDEARAIRLTADAFTATELTDRSRGRGAEFRQVTSQ